MKPIRTAAVFAGCAAVGGVMLPLSGILGFLGFVPALLLPVVGFMIAGGFAGAAVDGELSKGVVRLACAFALVGISALAFGLLAHSAEPRTVLSSGGGSLLLGFGLAGVVAGVGSGSGKWTAAAVLAFGFGGALGASAAVFARLLAQWGSLNSAMVGTIVRLGAAGMFLSWFRYRVVRRGFVNGRADR